MAAESPSSLAPSLPRGCTDLDTEDILAGVAFEQGPLRRLALQQVDAHSHLPARHIRPKALTDPPEGQVPALATAGDRFTCEGTAGRDPRHPPKPQAPRAGRQWALLG